MYLVVEACIGDSGLRLTVTSIGRPRQESDSPDAPTVRTKIHESMSDYLSIDPGLPVAVNGAIVCSARGKVPVELVVEWSVSSSTTTHAGVPISRYESILKDIIPEKSDLHHSEDDVRALPPILQSMWVDADMQCFVQKYGSYGPVKGSDPFVLKRVLLSLATHWADPTRGISAGLALLAR